MNVRCCIIFMFKPGKHAVGVGHLMTGDYCNELKQVSERVCEILENDILSRKTKNGLEYHATC